MLPRPEIGQIVRLENYDGRLIIESVSKDGGMVDLVSESDSTFTINGIPCLDLLPADDYSADLGGRVFGMSLVRPKDGELNRFIVGPLFVPYVQMNSRRSLLIRSA